MSPRRRDINAIYGEKLLVANNWTAEAEKRGTTVSASTWTYTGAGTLSDVLLEGATASGKLAPTCGGCLENTVTLANGEVLIAVRVVNVACAPTHNLTA